MDAFYDSDTLFFFENHSEELALYQHFLNAITDRFSDVTVKVQKTQISFACKYGFAYAWLPRKSMQKGQPGPCLGISFGLSYPLNSPRIFQKSEPYPNRWTHHLLISSQDQIDEELMGWITLAHNFSNAKR